MIDLAEFKRRAIKAFGANLEHATPANVREFVDQMQQEMWREDRRNNISKSAYPTPIFEFSSEDQPITYEAAIRQFFSAVLGAPDSQALLLLWLYALDLAYSGIEQLEGDSLGSLFSE